jgi:hypothetical protein
MVEDMRLKNYCFEVPLNAINSLPNIVKIYPAVQKLLVWDTHTQTGDLISILSFLESRLKRNQQY